MHLFSSLAVGTCWSERASLRMSETGTGGANAIQDRFQCRSFQFTSFYTFTNSVCTLLYHMWWSLCLQEVFVYKIELNVIQYTMAILDYVSADILKVCIWPSYTCLHVCTDVSMEFCGLVSLLTCHWNFSLEEMVLGQK